MSSGRSGLLVMGALALAALAALAWAWALDRDSVERANRLHRAKGYQQAAKLYAVRIGRTPNAPALRYNYGTALLNMNNAAAGEVLTAVATSASGEVRLRALNNFGLWRLGEAASALGQNRARDHANAAIKAFRDALRQQPGYSDASWNLTIALRLLAAIDAGDYQNGGDGAAGEGERAREMTPAAKPDKNEKTEQQLEQRPTGGEGETAARADAMAGLSRDEAGRLLATAQRDPGPIVSKLMALEGRTLRQSAFGRPDR